MKIRFKSIKKYKKWNLKTQNTRP